ncbi:hypothetical protein PTNB85_01116 [Pyrenophora teres f. teres]|nr:hypothetical protein PTNB85_01116 [Pyrenophora teres f. teres]
MTESPGTPGTAVANVSGNSKLIHKATIAALEGKSATVSTVTFMFKNLLTKFGFITGRFSSRVVIPLHPLSHFERLPTELVQQIASYLIHLYDHGESVLYAQKYHAFECKDFLPLRLTSRTIAAKVDYEFTRGFRTHIVQYSEEGIRKLLCLSKTATRNRVRALMFVAARDMATTDIPDQTVPSLAIAIDNESLKKSSKEGAIKASMLVKALKKFPSTLRLICVAPSLNKCYPVDENPANASALKRFLGSCRNLKVLRLYLDKASKVHIWDNNMQPTALWNKIHDIQTWKLQSLVLSGWVMCNEGIKNLLNCQLPTLVYLRFHHCSIEHNWLPVLNQLVDAPLLKQADFDHVSDLFERVAWRDLVGVTLEDENEEDWIEISYLGVYSTELRSHNGSMEKDVALAKQRVFNINRIAHPRSLDALDWAPRGGIPLRERVPCGVKKLVLDDCKDTFDDSRFTKESNPINLAFTATVIRIERTLSEFRNEGGDQITILPCGWPWGTVLSDDLFDLKITGQQDSWEKDMRNLIYGTYRFSGTFKTRVASPVVRIGDLKDPETVEPKQGCCFRMVGKVLKMNGRKVDVCVKQDARRTVKGWEKVVTVQLMDGVGEPEPDAPYVFKGSLKPFMNVRKASIKSFPDVFKHTKFVVEVCEQMGET